MIARWILATLHLLALGVGLGAISVRAAALRGPLDEAGIKRVLRADAAWGIAALLWIGTGLIRAFGGFEKGTSYYLGNDMFWAKMAALGVVLVLEIWPMVTFIRWRIAIARGQPVDTSRSKSLYGISVAQATLVIAMVFAATAMARGLGL